MLVLVPFLVTTLGATQAPTLAGTFRHDPVLLVDNGKKEVGALPIFTDRYGYRYLFTTWATRSAFLKDPSKYEIQMGGGCGNMGSLSGRGSTDLFHVHEGKIFIFASYGCREHFKSMPEKLIERDDAPTAASESEARRGREIADKALAWAGGAGAVRKLESLQFEWRESVKSGGVDYAHTELLAFSGSSKILKRTKWNNSVWEDRTELGKGLSIGSSGARELHPQQIRELARLRNGMLVSVLRAMSQTDVKLKAAVAQEGLERVEVFFDGTRAELEVDPRDGRIASLEFPAGRSVRGREKHVFASFTEVQGVKLPSGWTEVFDGKEVGKKSVEQIRYTAGVEGLTFAVSG